MVLKRYTIWDKTSSVTTSTAVSSLVDNPTGTLTLLIILENDNLSINKIA